MVRHPPAFNPEKTEHRGGMRPEQEQTRSVKTL